MKRNWMNWMVCLMLIISLLVPAVSASAAEDTAYVKVRLVGLGDDVKESWLPVRAGSYVNTAGESVALDKPTAMGALVQIARMEHLDYKAETTAYGVYVKQVGTYQEKKPTANMGWGVWVNGKAPGVGAESAEIKSGDEIVWGFYDWEKTLYPQVEMPKYVKAGVPFEVKVTAEQTTYDAEFNPTVTTVNVEGATVKLKNTEAAFVTDANGVAQITLANAGLAQLTVEKFNTDGTPLLLRSGDVQVLAAWQTNTFTDLAGYEWATASIQQLADKGIVIGDGAGHFAPGRSVSRGELAKILSLSGDLNFGVKGGFMDVGSTHPFKDYVQNVAYKGYMNGYAAGDLQAPDYLFKPEQGLTREELAVVLVRVAGLQPSNTKMLLPYSDRESVKEYAVPYLLTAYQNGLMKGDAEGTFRPQATVKRAEAAKALVNVLSKYDVK